jgi:hypothetical protein
MKVLTDALMTLATIDGVVEEATRKCRMSATPCSIFSESDAEIAPSLRTTSDLSTVARTPRTAEGLSRHRRFPFAEQDVTWPTPQ